MFLADASSSLCDGSPSTATFTSGFFASFIRLIIPCLASIGSSESSGIYIYSLSRPCPKVSAIPFLPFRTSLKLEYGSVDRGLLPSP